MENSLILTQRIDSMQIKQAITKLEPYIALINNSNRTFKSGISLKINENFDDVSLKRTRLYNSMIWNSSFINSALTGSYFSETEFISSVFDKSNLQYCHFIGVTFRDVKIYNTNLSYSNFYNTGFINTEFKGSTVSELLFDDCTFENCVFTASMLENAIFSNCLLKNVQFADTNIEYMELKNSKLTSVIMPFAQISYVYGACRHLHDGDIQIQGGGHILSVAEYHELQEALIVYYASIAEYFPLANLYLARQDLDNLYQCISLGLQSSITSKNFRMLKFFCKLAVQGSLFEYKKLRELYSLIDNWVKQQDLNIYEQRDFIHNFAEIRSLLLDNIYDFPTVQIVLQTNIDSNESERIIKFIEYVDSTIHLLCTKQTSHIEYRHNSDANFIAFLSAHYTEILLVITTLMAGASNIEKHILNAQQIKLNQLKIKKEAAELKKMDEAKDKGELLKKEGIKFEMKYFISNANTKDIQNTVFFL